MHILAHQDPPRQGILDLFVETFDRLRNENALNQVRFNDFINERDKYYNTALMDAALRNYHRCAGILVDKLGCNKDLTNHMQHSAMTIAAMNGHIETVKALQERGVCLLTENVDGRNCLDNAQMLD